MKRCFPVLCLVFYLAPGRAEDLYRAPFSPSFLNVQSMLSASWTPPTPAPGLSRDDESLQGALASWPQTSKKPSVTGKTPIPFPLEEALLLLKDHQIQALNMLKQLQKTQPASRVLRYNLALAYYQQQQIGWALAYWRQLLFEEAFDFRARKALKQAHFEHPESFAPPVFWPEAFWLYLPPDGVLALIALMSFLGLFLWYRENSRAARLWGLLYLLIIGGGGYYFFLRQNSHVTLLADTEMLSAPHTKALPLLKKKEGALLKVKSQTAQWIQVQLSLFHTGWIPKTQCLSLKRKDPVCQAPGK